MRESEIGCLVAVVFCALMLGLYLLSFLLDPTLDSRPELSRQLEVWSMQIDPNSIEVCGPNLIRNGDFEDPNTQNWYSRGEFSQKKEQEIMEGVGWNDSRGVMLSLTPEKDSAGFYAADDNCFQSVEITHPPEFVLVTCRVRTEGLSADERASLFIACYSEDRQYMTYSVFGRLSRVGSAPIGGTSPWTKIVLAVPVHPDTERMEVKITVWVEAREKDKRVFVDDIQAFPAARKSEKSIK